MALQHIDWAVLTRAEHKAVFAALVNVHDDVVSRVQVGEGRDNMTLLTLAVDINAAMRTGDDDLVRRELESARGDHNALR